MTETKTRRPHIACSTVCLTTEAYHRIRAADAEWIGTDDYMGLAYFWAYEYRYPMRDVTSWQRVRVHRAFMDAGLELDGESPEHKAIIDRIVKP